jgi:hypothetical protein
LDLPEETPFDWLVATEEQRAVIESLSQEELALLNSIKQRLEAVSPDVHAHVLGAAIW